jgi:hypothetical protein
MLLAFLLDLLHGWALHFVRIGRLFFLGGNAGLGSRTAARLGRVFDGRLASDFLVLLDCVCAATAVAPKSITAADAAALMSLVIWIFLGW